MTHVVPFPIRKSYEAKLFEVSIGNAVFKIAGTLDGFVDFYVGGFKTFPMTLDECRLLIVALNAAVDDVSANCLYDRDPMLEPAE